MYCISWSKSAYFLCRLRSSASASSASSGRHTFGFQSITFEGIHQFHSKFTEGLSIIKYRSGLKKESKLWCKDQELIQSSTTPDPGYQWESDKLTEDTTNESQEVSPFPAGDHKAHINRRAQNIANTRQNKNIKIHKRSTALERSVKYFTGGLKPV